MQVNPPAPTLVMNNAGARQQVPLRDYLNARIAPFLKKAMTESIASEAEFPLQWLGECLIHQSMLYEGNPDTTNIRERFRYTFEAPSAKRQPEPPTEVNGIEPISPIQRDLDATAAAAAAVDVPAPPDTTMTNGDKDAVDAQAPTETPVGEAPQETELHAQPETETAPTERQDVDMGETT